MSDRQARVGETGAGIFLTPADLRALGVDPEVADAVGYTVTERGIIVGESERER